MSSRGSIAIKKITVICCIVNNHKKWSFTKINDAFDVVLLTFSMLSFWKCRFKWDLQFFGINFYYDSLNHIMAYETRIRLTKCKICSPKNLKSNVLHFCYSLQKKIFYFIISRGLVYFQSPKHPICTSYIMSNSHNKNILTEEEKYCSP